MARVRCPTGCVDGYHHSSGDGWDEWDECKCCNPDGNNDSGLVDERRLAAWRKKEAEEEKLVAAQISEWEAKMALPCTKCGVPLIDHVNRDGEPCKSVEQFNKEWRAAQAVTQ